MSAGAGLRKAASWGLSFVVSGVLLYYSLRGVDWRGVWQTITHAQWPYLLGGAAITSCSFFLRAVRWRILLNAEADFSIGTVFWANMAGYLGNSFPRPRRRSAPQRPHQQPLRLEQNLRPHHRPQRAADGRDRARPRSVAGASHRGPKPRWMADLSRTMAIVASLGALVIMVLPHTGTLLEKIIARMPLPERLRNILSSLTAQILLGMRAFHDWSRFGGFVVLTLVIWAAIRSPPSSPLAASACTSPSVLPCCCSPPWDSAALSPRPPAMSACSSSSPSLS